MRLRVLALVLAALFTFAMAFGLGVIVGARKGWLQPVVTVTIVNQTGQTLNELRLVYKSSRSNGTVELKALPPGDRAVARFYVPGEASYTIIAKQSDGKALKGQEAYVEPGYTMTEVLSTSGATGSMNYRGSGG